MTKPSAAIELSGAPNVERLAWEVAELRTERAADRAEHAADRAELEALRIEVNRQGGNHERSVSTGQAYESPRRRLGRRRDGSESEASSGLVSRRRIFGLLGGAAAAGAGLAVAGSALSEDPAGATAVTPGTGDGQALQIGGNNSCGSTTTLTSSAGDGPTFSATAAFAGDEIAIQGEADNGTLGTGVRGIAALGYGLRGSGGRAPLFLDSNAAAGAPTTGLHGRGEFWVDTNSGDDHHIGTGSSLFYCVASGTPGTWVNLTAGNKLITLATPNRVYDSRTGQPNQPPNVQGSLAFTNPPPTAASRTINCTKDATSGTTVVPAGATSLLLNLTVISIAGVGALAVYPTGASQPSSSSINWSAGGQVLANGLTSACDTTQRVDVAIVASTGASTDFILDVIGYYSL